MQIIYLTIFPELFSSFLSWSLIKKSQEKAIVTYSCINPRDFCTDKHQQVDDEVYWWGPWLLLKAQPCIDALKHVLKWVELSTTKVLLLSPSQQVFSQSLAHGYAETCSTIVFVCWRYEWIDARFEQWCKDTLWSSYEKVSLGSFVTLWGEAPAMVMTEAIVRLLPWCINDEQSRKNESYSIEDGMTTLEYPQYTRPQDVEWYIVPDVLLSGNHAEIAERRKSNTSSV